VDLGGKAFGLSVYAARVYVSCHDQGVRILDFSNPAGLGNGAVVGSWDDDYAVAVDVIGSTAVVAKGRRGLSIVDLAPLGTGDPAGEVQRTGSYYTGGTAHRCVAHSNLLLVADGREGLKILDMSPSSGPLEVGVVSGENTRDVAVIPGFTLVADGPGGVGVCDLSDPENPVRRRTLDIPGARRIVFADPLAAIAGSSGVDLYDFTDPLNPELFGRFESAYVEGIFIEGKYLYVAEGHRGLQVIDIRSFDSPVHVSACPDIYAVDVAVSNGYALVSDSTRLNVVKVLIPEWLRRSSSRR
jgi:hypothetical protein